MIHIITTTEDELTNTLEHMNTEMREWTMQAARGECAWICADCSCSFSSGMPDECAHGHQRCTDIIMRDKANAKISSSN